MQNYPNPTDPGKGVEDDDDRQGDDGERRNPETGQPRRDEKEPQDPDRP